MRTLEQNKIDLVAAHRNQDWETAKLLSQEKKTIMRSIKSLCVNCGVRIKQGAKRCQMHDIFFRYHGKRLTACLLAMFGFVAVAASPVTVQVFWNPTQPNIDLYILHGTNNITAPMPWPVITTFQGSSTNASVSMFPGQMFFYLTASNFWGESGPSNVASLPNVATNADGFKITR